MFKSNHTDAEHTEIINYIKDNIDVVPLDEICKKVGYSDRHVRRIIHQFGINQRSHLTIEQKRYIDTHWKEMAYPLIAKELGVTRNAVAYYAKSKGFKVRNIPKQVRVARTYKKKPKTEDMERFIVEHHDTMTLREIAESLGKAIPTIAAYERRLGLTRRKYLTVQQMDFIDRNWKVMSFKRMAEYLGVSISSVHYYARLQDYVRGAHRPKEHFVDKEFVSAAV